MASGSFSGVGFGSSRRSSSYRGGGGAGVRGRFAIGSSRGMALIKSAATSSMAQWAMEQHQELLAARDVEAMNKLAQGGTADFIQYATERIAALGDGPMKDKWDALLKQAQYQSKVHQTENLVAQYGAQLQAGEGAGSAYLSFLNGELSKYDPGSDEYTNLVKHIGDAQKWVDMNNRAMEKRHDEEMAASVQEGTTTLEQALDYYKGRRDQLKPGDEAYGTLTKSIADIQNGIQARDFNAEINKAHAQLIEDQTKDPIAAKQAYLAVLTKLMNTARDPAAQQKLFEQVQTVNESIKKDQILQDMQVTNGKMVDYFSGKGEQNATTILQYLAEKAKSATDPTEANRYLTLAEQVTAHERQKSQDAIAAANRAESGGGPGFTITAVNRALNPFEKAYKDAADAVQTKIDRGMTPTQADWAILAQARDNYQNVIGQAYAQANPDARGTLDNLIRTVKDDTGPATPRDTQGNPLPGAKAWDFGNLGEKMAGKLLADVKLGSDEITRLSQKNDDPELLMQAIGKQVGDINAANASPFTQNDPKYATQLNELRQGLDDKIQNVIRASVDVLAGTGSKATAQLAQKFYAYQDAGGQADWTTWYSAVTSSKDAQALSSAVGANVTGVQMADYQSLVSAIQKENDTATKNLVTATQQRLPNGQIDPAWQAGGALDESTRAANIQKVLSGQLSPSDLMTGAGASAYAAGAGPTDRSGGGATDFGTAPTFPAPLIPGMGPFGKGGFPSPIDQSATDQPVQTDVTQAATAAGGPTPTLDAGVGDQGQQQPPDQQMPAEQPPPDPWAASGFLDAAVGAALSSSGFGGDDPHAAAWDFLNQNVDFALPSFTMPDLPAEPTFMPNDSGSYDFGTFGGPTLTSGDYGSPSFDVPPPNTNYDFAGAGGGGTNLQ